MTKEHPLTVACLQRHRLIGNFTAYQILSDMAVVSNGLIDVPCKLGNCVKLDRPLSLEDVQNLVLRAND